MNPDLRKNYDGDLSLRHLANEVLHSFTDNPTANRLWRLMRRTVVLLTIANALAILLSSLPVFVSNQGAGAILIPIAGGIGGLVALGAFLIMVLAPFIYPRWALDHAWRKDEAMRLTDQTVRERLLGILSPLIGGYVAINIPGALLAPISLYNASKTLSDQFGGGMIEGLASGVGAVVSTWTITLVGVVGYAYFCSVIVTRSLVVECRPETKPMFQRGFIAGPAFRIVITFVLLSILRSTPFAFWMSTLMTRMVSVMAASAAAARAGGPPPAPTMTGLGGMEESFWVLSYLFMIVIDILSIYILHHAGTWYWRRDIPIAREFLFQDADDSIPPALQTNLRLPPPPPIMSTP